MSHDKPLGTTTHYDTYLTPTDAQLSQCPPLELLAKFDDHLNVRQSIDEIGIIYVDPALANPFLVDEAFLTPERGKLGIASWSLRTLFRASAARFNALRAVNESRGSGTTTTTTTTSSRESVDLLKATRSLLVLHPYSYTAWNVRKSSLQCSKTKWEVLSTELQFVDLIFTLHPKVCEVWEHRSWCVR
jgi:hypothetical protein